MYCWFNAVRYMYMYLLHVIIIYYFIAYGYGFLMILLVCLGSLSGIFLVPLIKKDSKVGKQTYEYVYALLIATGSSALVSDAILHLIPHVSLYTGIWIVTDCLTLKSVLETFF